MTWQLPIENSPELTRRKLNTILGEIEALAPGYGGALPTVGDQPDGRFFAKTGASAGLYQVRSGAWVLVAS